MDNGSPWGTQSTLPSAMGLWLVGLDIDLIYGRPARSTDNAVVERSHGVLANWVEIHGCQDVDELQARVQWAVHTQRERYRQPNRKTRCQNHPELYTNPRSYAPHQDRRQWRLKRVKQYMRDFRFQRKVEKNGSISLFTNTYSIGKAYARQMVEIQLDPHANVWIFRDSYGAEVRRHPTKEFTYEQISQLKLAKRRRN